MGMLETEFSFFRSEVATPWFQVVLHHTAPPFEKLPQKPANNITTNALTYDCDDVRWNDFHGEALSRYDYQKKIGEIWCGDVDFLHELAYLLILSLTGKALDQRGFHKVHACGIRYKGRDILVMLPSMGGKTSLFLELATHPGVSLLSDDTPLISPAGVVLPFPLRLGIERIPPSLKGEFPVFKRKHYTPKFLVPLSALAAPLAQGAGSSTVLVFGYRSPFKSPVVSRISPWRSWQGLLQHMVVGLGLPMVIEYFVRHTPGDWLKLIGIALRRARAALRLLQRSESWNLYLSDDHRANARALLRLVDRHE